MARRADISGFEKIKKSVSNNIWFIFLSVAAIAGYLVGLNSNNIYGLIAPLWGEKVYTAEVDLSSVESTYRALKANYDGELDDTKLIEGASRGLVEAAGDEYTEYMNADEVAAFDNDLSGNIGGGIGAEISIRKDRVAIIRVLRDNPAESAGLRAGDLILEINDESTDEMSVADAVRLIRGDVGTTVKLTVLRSDKTLTFSVTRDTVINPSAYHKIEDGVGVLVVSRFDTDTYSLARAAVNEFLDAGVAGVVLDLRGNGGGYLEAAKDLAGLWLDKKLVVSEMAGGKVIAELKSGASTPLRGVPTAVLINGSSASASEIVAGALQDHGVAKIIGENSFGKGSVQKLITLPEGAQLKVTIARWHTPNGSNITESGITPDVKVDLTQKDLDAGKDPQLRAAFEAVL